MSEEQHNNKDKNKQNVQPKQNTEPTKEAQLCYYNYKIEFKGGSLDGEVTYCNRLPAAYSNNTEVYELYQERTIYNGFETNTTVDGEYEEDIFYDEEDIIDAMEDMTVEFTRMTCVYIYKLVKS